MSNLYKLHCYPSKTRHDGLVDTQVVEAVDAIGAVRATKLWQYASDFVVTKNKKGDLTSAHTQDQNGLNGCKATLIRESE